jgi:hypothetical protein
MRQSYSTGMLVVFHLLIPLTAASELQKYIPRRRSKRMRFEKGKKGIDYRMNDDDDQNKASCINAV